MTKKNLINEFENQIKKYDKTLLALRIKRSVKSYEKWLKKHFKNTEFIKKSLDSYIKDWKNMEL